jgi:hypothetical protein
VSGRRFVLDIGGTLVADAHTGPPTRLQPHAPQATVLEAVSDAMLERLLPVRTSIEREQRETGRSTSVAIEES